MAIFFGIGFSRLVCRCFNAFIGGNAVPSFAILEYQGTNRANLNTLIADMASRLSHGLVLKGGDYPIEAAVGKSQHTHTEALMACPYAPIAQDTLIGVVGEGFATRICRPMVYQLPETLGIYLDSENGAELLELACAVFGAMSAVHWMAGQKKLQSGASQSSSLRSLSVDHHAFRHRLRA